MIYDIWRYTFIRIGHVINCVCKLSRFAEAHFPHVHVNSAHVVQRERERESKSEIQSLVLLIFTHPTVSLAAYEKCWTIVLFWWHDRRGFKLRFYLCSPFCCHRLRLSWKSYLHLNIAQNLSYNTQTIFDRILRRSLQLVFCHVPFTYRLIVWHI